MTAYLIGVDFAGPGGGPLDTIGASVTTAVPAGDLVYVVAARRISYPVISSGNDYGQVFDTAANVYVDSFSGSPVNAGSPSVNTAPDPCAFDTCRQQSVIVNPLGVGSQIKMAFNPANNGTCLGAVIIVIGIPSTSVGGENVSVGGGNTGVFQPVDTSPPTASINTIIGWAAWDSSALVPTHSPTDDGYTRLATEIFAGITLDLCAITTGPVASVNTHYSWSAPVGNQATADLYFAPAVSLFIYGFPIASMQAISCKRDFCVYPWFG